MSDPKKRLSRAQSELSRQFTTGRFWKGDSPGDGFYVKTVAILDTPGYVSKLKAALPAGAVLLDALDGQIVRERDGVLFAHFSAPCDSFDVVLPGGSYSAVADVQNRIS